MKYAAWSSHEKIARVCGLSKGAVARYLRRAQAADPGRPLPDDLDDAALQQRLFGAPERTRRLTEPDFSLLHQALKRIGGHVRQNTHVFLVLAGLGGKWTDPAARMSDLESDAR